MTLFLLTFVCLNCVPPDGSTYPLPPTHTATPILNPKQVPITLYFFSISQLKDGGQAVILTEEQELQVHKLLLLPEAIEGAEDPAKPYMSLWREYWQVGILWIWSALNGRLVFRAIHGLLGLSPISDTGISGDQ
jgi:hypothetical protein